MDIKSLVNIKKLTFLLFVFSSLFAFAEDITIKNAWARPAPLSRSTAAYMQIKNSSGKDYELTTVETNISMMSDIHKTVIKKDISQMVHIHKLIIPAGKIITLEPKGLHIMIIGVKKPLNIGDDFELKLHFNNGTNITAKIKVKKN